MGNSSYFLFDDDDNKTKYIDSLYHHERNGLTERHSPTYCKMDNWENMSNFTHTQQNIFDKHL